MERRRGEPILGMILFCRAAPAEETRFIAQQAIEADVICTPLSHQDNPLQGFKAPKKLRYHNPWLLRLN
jgi:hypothetical protein